MRFTLKPIFVSWITLLLQLPYQIFFAIWAGGFLGGMLSAIQIFPPNSNAHFFGIGFAVFICFPVLTYIFKKLNYERTEYKFLEDRMEFEEGFFNVSKKNIKYVDIKEVTLRKGILQRSCGLGTIYLATMATGSSSYANPFSALGFGGISASGIAIKDIKEPDENYEKIKILVDSVSN